MLYSWRSPWSFALEENIIEINKIIDSVLSQKRTCRFTTSLYTCWTKPDSNRYLLRQAHQFSCVFYVMDTNFFVNQIQHLSGRNLVLMAQLGQKIAHPIKLMCRARIEPEFRPKPGQSARANPTWILHEGFPFYRQMDNWAGPELGDSFADKNRSIDCSIKN